MAMKVLYAKIDKLSPEKTKEDTTSGKFTDEEYLNFRKETLGAGNFAKQAVEQDKKYLELKKERIARQKNKVYVLEKEESINPQYWEIAKSGLSTRQKIKEIDALERELPGLSSSSYEKPGVFQIGKKLRIRRARKDAEKHTEEYRDEIIGNYREEIARNPEAGLTHRKALFEVAVAKSLFPKEKKKIYLKPEYREVFFDTVRKKISG